jgi:hypothetical protein
LQIRRSLLEDTRAREYASSGRITSTCGRLAVAVMIAAAAAVAMADVEVIAVADALAAQRNVNGDSFVR